MKKINKLFITCTIIVFLSLFAVLITTSSLFLGTPTFDESAEAATAITPTIIEYTDLYGGKTYHLFIDLTIENAFSIGDGKYYIKTKTVNFRLKRNTYKSNGDFTLSFTATVKNSSNSASQNVYLTDQPIRDGSYFSVTVPADGTYTLTISGTCQRGSNTNNTETFEVTSSSFVVDSEAPDMKIYHTSGGNNIDIPNNSYIKDQPIILNLKSTSLSGFDTMYCTVPGTSSPQAIENYSSYFVLTLQNSCAVLNSNAPNGYYSFYSVDKLGHQTSTRSFYYDNTAPTISCTSESEYINTTIEVSTTDNLSLASFYLSLPNGTWKDINSPCWVAPNLDSDGIYTFYAEDSAGNRTSLTRVLDTINPTIVVKSNAYKQVSNNCYIKASDNLSIEASDVNISTVVFNDKTLSSSNFSQTKKASEWANIKVGQNTIKVTDRAGNSTSFSFVYDITVPTLIVNKGGTSQTSGEAYFKTGDYLELTATDTYISKIDLNGSSIGTANISKLSKKVEEWSGIKEGTNIFTVTDKAGNTKTFSFVYDKTDPEIFIIKEHNNQTTDETSNESYFAQNDKLAVRSTETYLKEIKLNDTIIATSNIRSQLILIEEWNGIKEGTNIFTVTDKAGNTETFSFVYDKTVPTLIVNKGGTSQTSGEAYFKTGDYLELTATDTYISKIDLNGSSIGTANISKLSKKVEEWSGIKEGTNIFTVTDKAGNTKTFSFVYDKTDPEITVPNVTDGGYTNNSVTVSYSDTNLNAPYSGTYSLNGINKGTFSSGKQFSTDGKYEITVTDKAGNSSFYIFTIDKTAPKIDLTNATNGGYTKSIVTVTLTETNLNSATYSLNGADAQAFMNKDQFSAEGEYIITVTDKAGNSASASFIIDNTYPEIEINGLTNAPYSNGEVTVTITELYIKTATYSLNNGEPQDFSDGKEFTSIGEYTVTVADEAGNSATASFIIDTTAPRITLTNVTDGGYTNQNVTVSFSDAYKPLIANCILNGKEPITFSSGEIFSTQGVYKISVTDPAGNSSTVLFTIDKTDPTITLTNVTDGGYTNNSVTVSYSDTNLNAPYSGTYSLNGINKGTFSSGKQFSTDGKYTVIVTDRAGNSSTVVFTIDKTVPVISLTGLTHDNFSYDNVSVKISETNIQSSTYSLNGIAQGNFQSGNTFSPEGTYSLTVIDKVGYETTVSFVIDKTDPTITLTNVSDNGYTNKTVTVTFSDATTTPTATYSLNGKDMGSFESETTFEEEGVYIISVADIVEHIVTATFTIDTTYPEIQIYGAVDKGLTKNEVYIELSDANFATAEYTQNKGNQKIYSSSVGKGPTLRTDGEYKIIVTDKAENSSTVTFTIDTTAPTINITGTINERYTSSSFTVEIKNTVGNSATNYSRDFTLYYKTPNTAFAAHTENSLTVNSNWVNGEYQFYGEDGLGNRSETQSIYLDTTAPILKLYINNNETAFQEGNIVYTNKNFSISTYDATNSYYFGHPNVKLFYQTPNMDIFSDIAIYHGNLFAPIYIDSENIFGGTATKPTSRVFYAEQHISWSWATQNDGFALQKIKIIKDDDAAVSFELIDNVTKYTLAIDSNKRTKYSIEATYNNQVVYYELYLDSSDFFEADNKSFISGSTLTEGKYNFYAIDGVNNATKLYTVVFDNTAPIGTLSGVENGGVTNSAVTFRWTEESCTVFCNGSEYKRGTSLSAEGEYEITITDRAGNSTTYHFTIDTTAPTGVLSGVENGGITNSDVSFTWTEEGATATLNGAEYQKATIISAEGNYSIVLTDGVGNTTTYSFEIDKTPYTANYDDFLKNGRTEISHWYETYDYLLNTNTHIQTIGDTYSFDNYDDAYAYSLLREKKLAMQEAGTYVGQAINCSWASKQNLEYYPQGQIIPVGSQYWIYYSKESTAKLYAYFDQTALNDVLAHYAYLGISNIYCTDSSNKPANEFQGFEDIRTQKTNRDIIYFSSDVTFKYKPNGMSLFINGTAQSYNYLLSAGSSYFIQEIDAAGNITEYTIYVDDSLPTINCKSPTGERINSFENDFNTYSSVYTSAVWNLSIADFFDELAVLKVTDENNKTTYLIGAEKYFTFSKSGIYTVTVADVARNKKTWTVYVGLEEPVISTDEVLSNKGLLLGFNVNIDLLYTYSTISNISILLDGKRQTSDYNSTPINGSTLNYYFATSGTYLIKLQDNFGRAVEYEYIFEKDIPRGTLATNSGLSVPDGISTTKILKFSWPDESCSAFLSKDDGEYLDYYSGTLISDEGKYRILLRGLDGKESYYSFSIDRTAPVGTLAGVTNGGYTRSAVTFEWDDNATVSVSRNNEDFLPQQTTNNRIIISAPISHENDAHYTLRLTDMAGNYRDYSFTIDTVPPEIIINTQGTLYPVLYQNVLLRYETNSSIAFTWNGSVSTSKLSINSSAELTNYSKNYNLSDENTYTLYLADAAGNEASATVRIIKTAPTGTLVGVENGGITNSDVTFHWDEEGCTVLVNGVGYEDNTAISSEGNYTIVLQNYLGTKTTYTFEIDKTAPTGTFNVFGIEEENKLWFNKAVSFSWRESSATATLNDSSYSNGTYITAEGDYIIVLTDRAGNSTTYAFEIDKTEPIGVLSGVENGGITNSDVTFHWDEEGATATLNGIPYENDSIIYSEGKYEIALYDKIGNKSIYTFEIDKTAPTGMFSSVGNEEGAKLFFNKSVSFSWRELSATATLNDSSHTSGSYITAEGDYILVLTDRAGNSTTYTFEIDKTAPTAHFYSNNSEINFLDYFNSNISITWDENAQMMLNGFEYEMTSLITEENTYMAVLTDRAGNTTTYTFEIDKTAPTGTFSTDYATFNGMIFFSKPTSFTWSELGLTATLNEEPYTKNTFIRIDDNYSLILTDRAGNSTTYRFVISQIAPTINFEHPYIEIDNVFYFNEATSMTWNDDIRAFIDGEAIPNNYPFPADGSYTVQAISPSQLITFYNIIIDTTAPTGTLFGVENDGATNSDVTFSWDEEDLRVTLNGTSYKKNTPISETGHYVLQLTDRAGNSTTYTFEIDKLAPTGTLVGVENGGVTNGNVYFTWDVSNTDIYATLNDFIYYPNTLISAEGNYTLVLQNYLGTKTTYTFEIDKTAPTGTLFGVNEYNYSKTSVKLLFSNENKATLNGNRYSSGTDVSTEGKYTIVLTDRAGNTTTYTFEIDKTLPVGTLVGVENGGATNSDVTFTWTEEGATATLNNAPYRKDTLITDEDSYTLILTDLAGNQNMYTFEIDKTPPLGILYGVTNGEYTNNNVSFSWDEEGATATLNNQRYSKNKEITLPGAYVVILTDRAGNTTTYTFEIDKTAPTGTLVGVENGGATNSDVTFHWDEEGTTATLNGIYSEKDFIISAEGNYSLVLTDRAGNSTTYTFQIDKTAPTGTLVGVENGGITNSDVTFTWTEERATATLNGMKYKSGTSISTAGIYTIILMDACKNERTYTFEINRTAPIGTLSGVENGGVTNDSVYFSWDEEDYTATLNGLKYIKNSEINEEGIYEIILYDKIGNSRNYTFEIDKTAPTGTLSGVEDGGTTNGNVSFSWDEIGATATLDNVAYKKNSPIATEGEHIIVLVDGVGNSIQYTFEIDKTAPTGTLFGVENGGITNGNVSFTWTEEGATATLNGYSYESSSIISDEGNYSIVLTDRAGNATTYTFEIDKTAPTGALVGVENGGITNSTVKFTSNELSATVYLNGAKVSSSITITAEAVHEIRIIDKAGNFSTYTFEIDKTPAVGFLYGVKNGGITNRGVTFICYENGTSATLNGIPYEYNTLISEENNYKIVLSDPAGNSTTYTFEIDTTAPTGTLVGVENGSITNNNVTFTWNERNVYCYILNELVESIDDFYLLADDNLSSYQKGTALKAEGTYSLLLVDAAENATLYAFEIDKTAPIGTLVGVENGGITNKNVCFTWDEEEAVGFLDGELYQNGAIIDTDEKHQLLLTDRAGNSSVYIFTIDKTLPVGTLVGVKNGGVTNSDVTFSWENRDFKVTLNGEAYVKNSPISASGDYIIEVTNNSGSKTTYSFEIDKIPPVGTLSGVENGGITNSDVTFTWTEEGATATLNDAEYQRNDIIANEAKYTLTLTDRVGNSTTYTFEIDKTAPTGTFNAIGNEEGDKLFFNKSVSFSWRELSATATLNGIPYTSGLYITAEGDYVLILTDRVGNSTTYTFEIDKTAPIGTLVGVENGGITNSDVTFTWTEEGYTVTINGDSYESSSIISAEGNYSLGLTDRAGNTTTYAFEIDKTAPIGTLSGVENGGITNSDVTFTWTEEGCTVVLNGIPYKKQTSISATGHYILELTDRAGNTTTYTFEIDKTAPIGTLVGVENGGITNSDVTFTWTEEGATATLNGIPYENDSIIYFEGQYEIALYDKIGNKSIYSFEIDKTSPSGTFNAVGNEDADKLFFNKSVSFSWRESSATATLNNSSYTSGSYITAEGDYILVLTDRAGNSTTYTFEIDKTAPTGTLFGVENGGITNSDVTFTWTEEGYTGTLNGDSYESSSIISAEGNYSLVLTDRAGNFTTYSFEIDKTAPIGALVGVENGSVTNGNVYFTWTEVGATVALNGAMYKKQTSITTTGDYTLILSDRAGNSTTYTFEIDKIPPVGTLSGVENGGITNSDVTFTWTEEGATATLNGIPYDVDSLIADEGQHIIILTDYVGNTTTYTFEIDKTSPTGTFNAVGNEDADKMLFNKSISFSWRESSATATLNGIPYTSGLYITAEGDYVLVLTDRAGNSTTYTFEIDKTAPTGTLSGVENGGITNSDVTFTWTEEGATATLNDAEYQRNDIIANEAKYTLTLTDRVGNSTTYTFEIDKTPPTGAFSTTGIEKSGLVYFNTSISINIETGATGTLIYNDTETEVKGNTFVGKEGDYVLILTDKAGNSTQYKFTVILPKKELLVELDSETDTGEKETILFKNSTTYTADSKFGFEVPEKMKLYVNDELFTGSHFEVDETSEVKLSLVDDAGNSLSITVKVIIPEETGNGSSLSAVDIILILIGCILFVGIVIFVIKAASSRKMKFKRK